ncbi:hypothetical protein OAM42_04905 [Candidatus Thioglobus sp.]|jgi:hypothetical protein|nr:hypothetical protein [Candidatus Thioglobus sp.]
MKYPIILFVLFTSFIVTADPISYSKNIMERFIHKDWVAYKERRLCRPMSEFLIGGSVASLAVFYKGSSWSIYNSAPYRTFIYGEYVKSYKLKFNGEYIDHKQITEALLKEMANGDQLTIEADIYKDYELKRTNKSMTLSATATISLIGSPAAFRFCGFIE